MTVFCITSILGFLALIALVYWGVAMEREDGHI